jgi:hypothetical protein
MRPIHEHEIHHVVGRHVNSRRRVSSPPRLGRWLLDLLPLPVLYLALAAMWTLALGGPAPWWVWVGAAFYGGLAGTAIGVGCAKGG